VVYDLIVPSDKLRLSKISQLLDLVPLPEEETRILSLSPVNNPYVVLSTIDILSFYGSGGIRGNDNPPTRKELRDG
jgi:hypothetical protein